MNGNQDYERQFEEFMNQPLSSDDSLLDYKDISKEGVSVSLSESVYDESSSHFSPAATEKSKLFKLFKKRQGMDSNKSDQELEGTDDNLAGQNSNMGGEIPVDVNEDVCVDGEDTLEEKEDKERFFKELEDGHTSPLNFSFLNKNLANDSGPIQTDLNLPDSVMDIPKSKHQEEVMKSRNDSDSDNSSKKLRMLKAINKFSLTSSTSNSLEISQSRASFGFRGDVPNIESDVVATVADSKGHLNGKSLHNLGDSHRIILGNASTREELLNDEIENDELQRIEEDYFDLKNMNQNYPTNEGAVGDGTTSVNEALRAKLNRLETQLQHQDVMLEGYQKENERMYKMSKQNKISKDDDPNKDNHLMQENFKLKNEIVALGEELNKLRSEVQVRVEESQSKEIDPRILDLEGELKLSKGLNYRLNEKVNFLYKELEDKRKVPRSESLKNVTKKMSQTVSTSKIKPQRKSLIPTLARRDKISSSSRKQSKHLIGYLEGRVELLEDELKRKDEEEGERFKLLQSDFLSVKMQYQDHLTQLEEQLKDKQMEDIKDGHCVDPNCRVKLNNYEIDISNLKRELQQIRDTNKTGEGKLKEELERFRHETESSRRLIKEIFDLKMQMSSLKNKYETDMKILRSMHSNALKTQESKTRHLEESLRLSNSKLGELSFMTKHSSELEMQISKLKEDLREAKKHHSPSMKHLEDLNEKIHDMKVQLNRRDEQLDHLLRTPQSRKQQDTIYELSVRELEIKHDEERNKWKNILLEKINEIQYFRRQLDIVLDFVKRTKNEGTANLIEIPSDTFDKVV